MATPALGSQDPSTFAFLFSCGRDSGVDTKEVANLAEMGLALDPKAGFRNFMASWAHTRAGDFDRAFQRAAFCSAAYPQAMFTLAMAYHGRRDRAGAAFWLAAGERHFDKALARNLETPFPTPFDSSWQVANGMLILGRETQLAIRGRLSPDNPWVRLIQARAHAHIGKPEKAEKDFAAAVEARPGDPQVWIARGRILAELGQHGRAEADFAKAIALAPNDPRTRIARGRYFAERGKHKEADADFAEAAGLSPNELNVFPESGWWVAGPYPADINIRCSPEENQSPDKRLPADKREKASQTKWLQWRPVATDANGQVNFGRLLPTQGLQGQGSYYGLCYIYSPNQQDAILNVGSWAPIRVWVNDKLVHQSAKGTWAGEPAVAAVRFHSGPNKILVKVTCTGPANFSSTAA